MKTIALALLCFCLTLFADEPCRPQAHALLKRWEPRLDLDGLPAHAYRFSTSQPGVLLEKWVLADGGIEVRRIRARRTDTVIWRGPGCRPERRVARRSFPIQGGGFTDEDLAWLWQTRREGIIYVWSPAMPLSVRGIKEVERFAAEKGLALTVLVDPHARLDRVAREALDRSYTRPVESLELMSRGILIHYPSVLFYRDGKPLSHAIPGFKRAQVYTQLWEAKTHSAFDALAPLPLVETRASQWDQIIEIKNVPTKLQPSNFFKVTGDGHFVSFSNFTDHRNYLLNLNTGEAKAVPGNSDPVVSPDGKFLTVPEPMRFFSMEALWAAPDATIVPAVYTDLEMIDQYQSLGIIAGGYRMLTAWHSGVSIRDYKLTPEGKIETWGKPVNPCKNLPMSVPMLSKDGVEASGQDLTGHQTALIDVTTPTSCIINQSLGYSVGKTVMSFDRKTVAFSDITIHSREAGHFRAPSAMASIDAYVCNRTGKPCTRLSNAQLTGDDTYPEFLQNGQVIFLRNPSDPAADRSFKIVELRPAEEND